jgi:hypothetical protein
VQILRPTTLACRRHAGRIQGDLSRTYIGLCHLIDSESAGRYPGGSQFARQRRDAITRHVRSASLTGLEAGRRREAWDLYKRTLRWHLQLGRWRYLLAFPLKACLRWFRSGRPMNLPAMKERNESR